MWVEYGSISKHRASHFLDAVLHILKPLSPQGASPRTANRRDED